jgi:hypothetical protein
MNNLNFSKNEIRLIMNQYMAGETMKDLCETYEIPEETFLEWKVRYIEEIHEEQGSDAERDTDQKKLNYFLIQLGSLFPRGKIFREKSIEDIRAPKGQSDQKGKKIIGFCFI